MNESQREEEETYMAVRSIIDARAAMRRLRRALVDPRVRVAAVDGNLAAVVETDTEDPRTGDRPRISFGLAALCSFVVLRRSDGTLSEWKSRYVAGQPAYLPPEEVARRVDAEYR